MVPQVDLADSAVALVAEVSVVDLAEASEAEALAEAVPLADGNFIFYEKKKASLICYTN